MFEGHHATAKTSNLNDELAQVSFVFSDKTGTLTQNEMVFHEASINGNIFDDSDHQGSIGQLVKVPQFYHPEIVHIKNATDKITQKYAKKYLLTLALAHSCQIELLDKKIVYKSASPDEVF